MKIKLLTLLVLIISFIASAQYIDQNITEPIDINSKASELGINAEQLQSILNFASGESKEGEGDPLPDAMQERFLTGSAANDNFGYTVSSAGDVNGDGYDDIIIGAPLNDAGGTDAGLAYIYYGGNIFNSVADIILTGAATNDQFGRSVSTVGDVNGDGYADVIVGANGYSSSTGRAYIFYGGTFMNNVADVILTGEAVNDGFGNAVSTAEDVNGDGYSDVIVGATGNDTGGTDRGRAYIYYGGASMNNVVDVILSGEAANDNFGNAVSNAGDVNGDGYSDVIVGAWLNDGGGTDAGRAYIFYGGSSMNNIADVTLTGEAANDWFAISASTAGDVNGDGNADIIVGSPLNDAGGSDAGRAYIYYGGSQMNNAADVTLTGAAEANWFGFSVSDAGDVNGDAFSDVVVGAFLNSAGGTNAGRAFLYWGGESMDNIADGIITGAAAFDFFGFSVSSAGDFNGDGYDDFIVGAYANDVGGIDAGRAYLYTNTLTGADIPDEFFTGETAQNFLGWSVSNAGDVNGDGYKDIIVGAQSYNNSQGRAYIYFGGSSIDDTPDVILTGAATSDQFGFSISQAGDVNSDGYDDVIVGARNNDSGGPDAGRAYIYFGGVSMDNIADVILTGEASNNWFGNSVSFAGDINGDGFDDVIVGAPWYDTPTGRAYLYFGSATMDNVADVILTVSPGSSWFGYSVSDAGDVNRDGYADVIVGAPFHSGGGSGAGQAYVYFGGVSMDIIADVILTGATGDNLGWSVASAGDVNNDSYSDVIVGAPRNDAAGTDAGRAYIYFGEAQMDNISDVTLTALAANNDFGWSVSSAGDVNDDGFDDVIVGAPRNDDAGTDAGRAYIYFGNYVMDNSADIIMTGYSANDWFGNSVSYAGDMNKDGYVDIIVGSPQNDAGGTDAGRTYLFLTSSPPIKPRIMSVKDVPNDQGGYVFVKFVRSGWDVRGLNRISGYAIEMSEPPINGRYNWVQIGTVMPLQESIYTYLAHTLYDSSANNGGSFFFRVTARVANTDEFYFSNILSGKSIDNLSPAAPFNFYANLNGSNVKLGWKANTEPDFYNFVIYRTDYPDANPDTLIPYAQSIDTTLIDTNPLSGTSYYYLRAQDVHNNLSQYVSATVSTQTTFALSVSVNNGWNMVSVPGLHPTNQNVNTWWQYRDQSANVFKYAGGYQSVTAATPGTGYWMKHSGARTYNTGDEWPAGGIQIVPHTPLSGASGWNLIAGYELSVTAADVTTNPPGLQSGPIYKYNAGYQIATTLDPGYGYWMKLTSAGQIIIPETMAKEGESVEYFPDNWGRITFTDATGINYTLYAVKGEIDLNQYELPPAPPSGMVDIRFSSGRIAEDINSSVKTIDMSGVTYPLTVRVEGMDMRLMDETAKTINVNLKSGEDIVIIDGTIKKLIVSEALMPDKFVLEQNYPNPFNPSTVIEFSLPEDVANVKLSVYNALGEKVAELVNTSLQAGRYQYQWNAGNVATGMYVYELRTDNFVSVKKMLLLK